jgi:tetratricopeptide (TPR) repeat protein
MQTQRNAKLALSGRFSLVSGETPWRLGRERLQVLAAITGAGSFSVRWLAADPDTVEKRIRSAYETLKNVGEKGILSTVASNLADVLYMKGSYEEAERLAREAEEAGASEDVATEVGWRNARAMLLARRGRHAEAETLAREALERATATEYLKSTAQSYLALGEVLRLAERPREAAKAIQEALRLYEAKGYTLSADTARARLEELKASRSPPP